MARRKQQPQWDYRARGLCYHKVFISRGLSRLVRVAAKEQGISAGAWIANLIEQWASENHLTT